MKLFWILDFGFPIRRSKTTKVLVLALNVVLFALCLPANSQQPKKLPQIGFLTLRSAPSDQDEAFKQALRDLGWIEGQNFTIEWRGAAGKTEKLAELAADLVRRKVDVIVASATPSVQAAKNATNTIPIVMSSAADPVGVGLVASLARPGGNITGLSNQAADLAAKRLELLREVVPGLRRLAIMANVDYPAVVLEMREVETAAGTLGLDSVAIEIRRGEDIAPVFGALKERTDALYVCADPLVVTHQVRINAFALAAKLPTMHSLREHIETGGLISYGANLPDLFRRAGNYVDKILRGAKPGDIPVEQPTKFDLVINLTTAKALGLTVPPSLLARTDEVIE